MKVHDLQTFQKKIHEHTLCLVICKDAGLREQASECVLRLWQGSIVKMEGSSFSCKNFFNEVETLPFLGEKRVLHLDGIEALSAADLKRVGAFLETPSSCIKLLLTSEGFSSQSKWIGLVEDKGIVYHAKEEKPWEKEKRLTEWLVQRAAKEGVKLAPKTAEIMVKSYSLDPSFLDTELQKLICYVGDKGQITPQDLLAISSSRHQETLWQLGEAVFARSKKQALTIAGALFEENEPLFPLLASLRSQVSMGMETLSLLQKGGQAAVQKAFPYLKGGFFEKKINLFQGYGKERFRKAFVHLYQTEVIAKNSSIDPKLLIEMLIIKLT